MSNTSHRTQIYLPDELRREIDRHRNGESLSEYLRKAAEEKIKKDKKEKAKIQSVIKSLKLLDPAESGWAGIDVIEWQRNIREDRDVL